MYKAIVKFADIQDNYTIYNPGDTYPRKGICVSDARLWELVTGNNRRGIPLIAAVEAPKTGGKPKKAEPVEDFMNKPEISPEQPVKEEAKKPVKRGRKKKDAE